MASRIEDEYYEWLLDIVKAKTEEHLDYTLLLRDLHVIPFRWSIDKDSSRSEDGKYLRYTFVSDNGFDENLYFKDSPCTVLEMLIALSIKCEDNLMWDPDKGDRTSEWFWIMIDNLDLNMAKDEAYSKDYVKNVIDIFLDRKYKKNGAGGLFRIRTHKDDLRQVDIWTQLSWYVTENY